MIDSVAGRARRAFFCLSGLLARAERRRRSTCGGVLQAAQRMLHEYASHISDDALRQLFFAMLIDALEDRAQLPVRHLV